MDGGSEAVRMWLVRPMRGGVAFLPGLGTDKVSHCSVRLVDVKSFSPLSLGLRLLRNWFVEAGDRLLLFISRLIVQTFTRRHFQQ